MIIHGASLEVNSLNRVCSENTAAKAWIEILPVVIRLTPRWLANAGYRAMTEDQHDIIAEAGVRFLAAFSPGKTHGVGSTLAYAKRCCLSAYRKLFPVRDAVTTAVRDHPRIESIIDDSTVEDVIDNVPALSDLSPRLGKRVTWFAAHPKKVSLQVRSRLRQEITTHIQSASGHATPPTGINISESCRGRDGQK